MKKNLLISLVILLSCVLLFTCSNPVNTGSSITAYTFNPPTWIIGTWSSSSGTTTTTDMIYKFTDHDITMSCYNTSIDFAESFKAASISETSSSTEYTITIVVDITESGTTYSTTAIYKFTKTSDTKLKYYLTTSGVTTGPITLYKK